MQQRFPTLAGLVFTSVALLSPALQADVAEVVSQDGQVMSFEYEGDKLRINIPDNQGYMILRDEHLYMVSENDGQVMVVDMNSAFSMFGGMAASATPEHVSGKLVSMKATGRSESLAGMTGEVYLVRFIDHEGVERESEVVLSPDKRAIGFRDAVANMAMTMASSMRQAGMSEAMDSGEEMQRKLENLNRGVLRYGEDMRVQSITETTVAQERFVLPAAPTDLGGMMRGMMGGSGGSSEGVGGYVEEKSERQQNRVEQKADDAVDRATDSAVDKALNKAFDKLFGN